MSHAIEGKVVVITGATSGIGEAAAHLLAKGGAKLMLGAGASHGPAPSFGEGPQADREGAICDFAGTFGLRQDHSAALDRGARRHLFG